MNGQKKTNKILRYLVILLCILGVAFTFYIRSQKKARKAPPPPKIDCEAMVYRDLQYYAGPGASLQKHSLDIYRPPAGENLPVVVFVHGGAWTSGDKTRIANVGCAFAKKGYVAVLPNYRLSPKAKHPDHITDIARAVKWTYQNIGRYGGRADSFILGGHSAGAHLVALLALDEKYLRAGDVPPEKIKAVICISGMYKIGEKKLGNAIFSKDPKVRAEASPMTYLTKKPPPFLILYAPKDLPTLDEQAKNFAKGIEAVGGTAELQLIPNTQHPTIIGQFSDEKDQTSSAVFRFLDRISTEGLKEQKEISPNQEAD